MNSQKFLQIWINVSGILILIMGMIHNAFAPSMYTAMSNDSTFPQSLKTKIPGLIYFFVVMGTAVILAGILMIYSSKGLKRGQKWAKDIVLISAVFVTLSQIAAIYYAKFQNPMIYFTGFVGLSSIIVLLFLFEKNKKEVNGSFSGMVEPH